MGKLKIDTTALEKQILEQIIKPATKQYNEAGIKSLKKIRDKSVANWYSRNAVRGVGLALINATFYRSKTIYKRNTVTILITSSVDIKKYESLKGNGLRGINRWRKKHEEAGWTYIKKDGTRSEEMPAVSMTKFNTTAEYIIDLKWNKGIIRLPKKSSIGTDWVNKDYRKANEPLKNAVKTDISKSWEDTVNMMLGK